MSQRGDQGEFQSNEVSAWSSSCDPRVTKRSPIVVEQKRELHHKDLVVVKLKVGLHYGCPNSDQKVFRGGEARDEASPWKFQKR